MSFIDNIKELEFEVDTSLLAEDYIKQFVPQKDMGSYIDYCYVIKYNRLPSRASMDYKVSDFINILKVLKDKGFKLLSINSSFMRNISHGYVFSHSSGTFVEIGNFGNIPTAISADDGSLTSVPKVKASTLVVYYDIAKSYDLIDTLKDNFSYVEELDSKGKILLFEKNEYNEMVLTPYPIKGYDLDINDNYNDDFAQVHERLQNWIPDFKSQNNKLVLFNGQPGTGKTNYLKYLLNNTPDVKKIYIPPYFVQSISDPAFFPIIRREKESLLIIEDAEKILVNREDQADNSTISILLNLCDGIMADVLNFKIIATFNTDESKIDEALKRKGRMFMHYKFDKLVNHKAANLYKKVHGIELDSDDDMTLADIYNDENQFGKKKAERKIGFGV
jgi:hypothetical protein